MDLDLEVEAGAAKESAKRGSSVIGQHWSEPCTAGSAQKDKDQHNRIRTSIIEQGPA